MKSLTFWILQTGEPLHIDKGTVRPMRAMNLSNALVEAGHKVILWSSAFHHQEKHFRSYTAKSIRLSDNLEIRLIPSIGYRKHIGVKRLIDHAQLALNLKKMLLKEANLPAVAFIGFPPIETAAVLSYWLAKQGVPSVIDVKDQWPSLFLDSVPDPLRPLGRVVLWPYFYLARRAIRDATCVTAMANDFLDWALRFAQRERTAMDSVFPLTSPSGQVSTTQLEEARQWWNDQGIGNDGQPRVCFVGSLSSVFDFKPVRQAAEISVRGQSPCDFVICGDGGSSTKLRAMMAGLPNIYFPGWVDSPKIKALAERCQGSLAPYMNIENFMKSIPNKIIDALSLGSPILSPLQGEVASLIDKHGVGMRYGTNTGKTLYDCIQTLARDSSMQKQMSKNCLALHKDNFSFEMVYGRLVEHLEKIALGHNHH